MMTITTDLFKESSQLRVKVVTLENELNDAKTDKQVLQKALEKAHASNKLLRTEIDEMKVMRVEVDSRNEELKQIIRQEKSSHEKTMDELWDALDTVNKANKALRDERILREAAEEKVEKWEQSARLEKVDHERTRGEVRSINDSLLREMKARFGELSDKLGMSIANSTMDQDQSSVTKTIEADETDIDAVKSQLAALTGRIAHMAETDEKLGHGMAELTKTFDDVLKKVCGAGEEKIEQKPKKKSGVSGWLKRKLTSKSSRGGDERPQKLVSQDSTQKDVSVEQ